MAGTVQEDTDRGRRLQNWANAVAKGGVTGCGDTRTIGRTTWVCTRPPHEGPQPAVDQWRRTHGVPVATDRHYYRAQETP